MRGRILEVPNLLDYTLLQERRRGVARLADVDRDECGWSGRECYSAGVLRQREASRLQQCERHGSVAPVQDGTEKCATVQDAGSYCSNAKVSRGSLSIGSVSSLTVMSEVGWISYLLLSN